MPNLIQNTWPILLLSLARQCLSTLQCLHTRQHEQQTSQTVEIRASVDC